MQSQFSDNLQFRGYFVKDHFQFIICIKFLHLLSKVSLNFSMIYFDNIQTNLLTIFLSFRIKVPSIFFLKIHSFFVSESNRKMAVNFNQLLRRQSSREMVTRQFSREVEARSDSFRIFITTKKNWQISALASKEHSNKKNKSTFLY